MVNRVFTEGFHPEEFLLSEGNGGISREEGVLTAGQNVVDGQAVVFSGGKLIAAVGTPDSDGDADENVAGLVCGSYDVDADTKVAYIARLATVRASAVKLHTTEGGGAAAATAAVKLTLARQFIILR